MTPNFFFFIKGEGVFKNDSKFVEMGSFWQNFERDMLKNRYISDILQKAKPYWLANSVILRLKSFKNSEKV
jgi:hypothetical protein